MNSTLLVALTVAPEKIAFEVIFKFAAALTVPPRNDVITAIVFALKIPISWEFPVTFAPVVALFAVSA